MAGLPRNQHPKTGFVVAFLESSVLELCSFLDLPGYNATETDAELAKEAAKHVDVLVFVSTLSGCVGEAERPVLGLHLGALPYLGGSEAVPLANFLLVVSRCGTDDSEGAVSDAISILGRDLYRHFRDSTLDARRRLTGQETTELDFRSRISPFSVDVASRASATVDHLTAILARFLPPIWSTLANSELTRLRKTVGAVGKREERKLRWFQDLAIRHETLGQDLHHWEAQLDRRREEFLESREAVLAVVDEEQRRVEAAISTHYQDVFSEEFIVKAIDEQYADDKKKAGAHITGFLSEALGGRIQRELELAADRIKERLDYDCDHLQARIEELGLDFPLLDVRSVMVASLSGFSAVGLLGAWASVAAAGSNLGGYILVAKVASLIGVSSAGLVTAVAAIGGPLVASMGIGIVVAAVSWGLLKFFGPSWQESMARKVIKQSSKRRQLSMTKDGLHASWEETREGIHHIFEALIAEVDTQRANLKEAVENPLSLEELEKKVQQYRDVRRFFDGLPW